MSCLPDSTQADAFTPPIAIPAGKPVHLRVEVDFERLHFAYRVEGVDPDGAGCRNSSTPASSLTKRPRPGCRISPAHLSGMACQDMAGTLKPADFDFFEYRERSFRANPFSA